MRVLSLVILAVAPLLDSMAQTRRFEIETTVSEHLDFRQNGKRVGRYVFAHDDSTPERREETVIPFLHLYDPSGEIALTKGPGGHYPHQRGIFLGWKETVVDGGTPLDRWSMVGGGPIHQRFVRQTADAARATITASILWPGREPDRPDS